MPKSSNIPRSVSNSALGLQNMGLQAAGDKASHAQGTMSNEGSLNKESNLLDNAPILKSILKKAARTVPGKKSNVDYVMANDGSHKSDTSVMAGNGSNLNATGSSGATTTGTSRDSTLKPVSTPKVGFEDPVFVNVNVEYPSLPTGDGVRVSTNAGRFVLKSTTPSSNESSQEQTAAKDATSGSNAMVQSVDINPPPKSYVVVTTDHNAVNTESASAIGSDTGNGSSEGVSSLKELMNHVVVAVPYPNGSGHSLVRDRVEGSSVIDIAMREFKECVEVIEVFDVNRSGLQFTWNQKPRGTDGKLKKIDRIMATLAFTDAFIGAHAIFQPYRISDHSSAILTIPTSHKFTPRPFKFYNIIVQNSQFKGKVKEFWDMDVSGFHMYKVVSKLKSLKKPLRKLLYNEGNIHDRGFVILMKPMFLLVLRCCTTYLVLIDDSFVVAMVVVLYVDCMAACGQAFDWYAAWLLRSIAATGLKTTGSFHLVNVVHSYSHCWL
ncbi:RNA-directed DNA polymerase, eukaryota, Reverse transcriptase zinc-binding domain protein [Artemisia annua]|uniref:RNA-directed DNA polymerase, eukaryota, Reverse transcriptase zinc-binding domain protein n=1 Tax=Artemisia annua TaxID=35608 RepID=A0A2U1LSE7_ARTAN|nr:RNA-directed DNA polymerase, eukaryota, Reverse transcriptase zinc-binding domain protein [Artemisia annua]